MIDLSGAYTALVTPFTPDGADVDHRRLASNISLQSLAGVTGVVPCGTTGESPTLTDVEHRAVVQATIETARPLGLQVIAGAGSNCTTHAIEMHQFACAAGADASLQVIPYYNRPSQEGLYRHFMAIADSCDLPVVLYNIPGRAGCGLTIEIIERLASHPNIVAIKEATGGLTLAEQVLHGTDLVVLSGDDPLTWPLLAMGGGGVISVLANVRPDRVAALCRAAARGDLHEAQRIHRETSPLARALLSLDTNPVPVKAALALLGLDTGAVRLPLAEASENARRKLAALLETTVPAGVPA